MARQPRIGPEERAEPYLLVLELAEGPRLLTHLVVDADADRGRDWIGTPVAIETGTVTPDGELSPLARPARTSTGPGGPTGA